MNIELYPSASCREAEKLLKRGDGDSLRAGASLLLHAAGEAAPPAENGAPLLNALLRALTEDPYRCLGVSRGCDASAVKKAYRRQALKHHPDKNANKTTVLFAAGKG
jgi:DnaJ-domain-containing protein 1